MERKLLRSDLLLLLTATIWGFAFVAQRIGMDHVGPFLYSGVRFLLGAVFLVPFFIAGRKRRGLPFTVSGRNLLPCLAAGTILFCAANLQQIGLQYTTAGKAGFITGLYVVLVPVAGLLLGRRIGAFAWIGAGLAVTGLYLLSVSGRFRVSVGDGLEFAGAFFWAAHILVIDRFSPRMESLLLSIGQFAVCGILSLACAALFEPIEAAAIAGAAPAILYGGILSIGVAYTLQVVAQKHIQPSHASIIMSLESVFAVVGGILLLDEELGLRPLIGCVLMFAGMVVSQTKTPGHREPASSSRS
jgi:drug/metabolite transporter (DMT)-like permease